MSYNVMSKQGMIAWLKKQPPEGTYQYWNRTSCFGAQYCHAHGLGYGLAEGVRVPNANPNGNFHERLEYISARFPHTIAAALARAKETILWT